MKKKKGQKSKIATAAAAATALAAETGTATRPIKIGQYRFCNNCGQLCPPNLLISIKAKSGHVLIDKCNHCGVTKDLDNDKCYSIVI
jgi:Pyruvate/2-oxoacid:ferredoxin oxidoreductase delta subunit